MSRPGTALSKVPTPDRLQIETALSKVLTSVANVSKLSTYTQVSKPNSSSQFFWPMFSGLSQCTINITPANFVVILQRQTEPSVEPPEQVCEELSTAQTLTLVAVHVLLIVCALD